MPDSLVDVELSTMDLIFPLFSQLPVELQLEVYTFAALEWIHNEQTYWAVRRGVNTHLVTNVLPSTLFVCRQSRLVTYDVLIRQDALRLILNPLAPGHLDRKWIDGGRPISKIQCSFGPVDRVQTTYSARELEGVELFCEPHDYNHKVDLKIQDFRLPRLEERIKKERLRIKELESFLGGDWVRLMGWTPRRDWMPHEAVPGVIRNSFVLEPPLDTRIADDW